MNSDEKILKALEELQTGQTSLTKTVESLVQSQDRIEKRLDQIEQDQSHMSTAIEALAEGQREIRETMATKADILDLGVKVNKNYLSTKKRLENLEERIGTHDPTEN